MIEDCNYFDFNKLDNDSSNLDKLYNLTEELVDRDIKLKRSKILFDSILEASRDGIWEWNLITNEIKWSDNLFKMLNYYPQEFKPTYEWFLSQIHPDDLEDRSKAISLSIKNKTLYDINYRVKNKEGNYIWFNVRGKILVNNTTEEPKEIIKIFRNIDIYKNDVNNLENIVHIIEGVLNIVNKHLILVNEDGEIIFISDNFSENIGYKVKELIGKNMNCLVPLEFRDKHLNSFKKLVIDIKDCCNTFNVLKSRNIPLVKKDNTLISVSLGVWFIGYDYVKFSKKIFAAIIGEI